MKTVVIVHGFSPTKPSEKENSVPQNERGWRGWIKKELGKRGISCISLLMPNAWAPKYSEWKEKLDEVDLDEDSILIGHSAGGAFSIRYLSETKKKIKKLILISPGRSGSTDKKELFDLYGNGDYKDVKYLVHDKIVIFTSEEDYGYHIKIAYEYEKELNAKVIKLGKGFGHFTSSEMKTPEFRELFEEVFK